MQFEPGQWYHVYNRGNNSQQIFFERENYLFFLKKMRKMILPLAEVIAYCLMPNHFHWLLRVKTEDSIPPTPSARCLCGLTGQRQAPCPTPPVGPQNQRSDGDYGGQTGAPSSVHPLVRKTAVLLSSYTQAINKQKNRSGSLFQSKTKARCLNSSDSPNSAGEFNKLNYPLICFHYIHQNPLRAGLVQQMSQWEFSSYRDYAGLRNGTLPDKNFVFDWLALKDEKEFIKESRKSLDPRNIKKLY